ncbi:MAG: sugar ABC transporter ATP-binding protein [Clostridiales bacterium]|nr:sugar ABC transporter ATP-binding protein [Clostridiales bacterium]
MAEDIVLEVRDIIKIFPGVRALSHFSLALRRGEIHGIVGENGAGKSTLMNIISGNMQPNKGSILVEGEEVRFENSRDAQTCGISIVHQELMNCPDVSVAENIFINAIDSSKSFFMNYKEMYRKASELLEVFQVSIDPRQKMKNLKVSDQQIVEIVRAISNNSKIVIFDEPTASLTEQESEQLFKIIKDLKAQGITMLYISHRMEEIFRNCDRVTILKDGQFVDTMEVTGAERSDIINKMVGRNLRDFYPAKGGAAGSVFFEVRGFSRGRKFRDISFELKQGEILGLSGLVGSGRTEIARAICGVDAKEAGEVYIDGEEAVINDYSDALKNGIVYLTEDRKTEGLMLKMSIMQNISVLDLEKVSQRFFMSAGKEKEQAERLSKEMNVRSTGIGQIVGTLSGGNQQKVLIAKSLSISPRIIFMDEPTRGVDVGAKVEIYNKLRELADGGVGIIMISSELPEVIGMCDRVIVVHEGCISGELTGAQITETSIMHKASGY